MAGNYDWLNHCRFVTTTLNIDANASFVLNIAFAVLYNNFYINDLLARVGPTSEIDDKILNDKLR